MVTGLTVYLTLSHVSNSQTSSNAITVGWGSAGSMMNGDDWVRRGCNAVPTAVLASMDASEKRATNLAHDVDRSEPRENMGEIHGPLLIASPVSTEMDSV